ncbi:hypothetical protein A3Q56_00134 [Intoshia linei]|uniref:Uncharacterized protein n=1 Tax=Intoshia linei TaxID=1819745 RepID=A0A177BD03_9BILA|nr:hypothetical protein A3Q56_00134 [Intoshia linei]
MMDIGLIKVEKKELEIQTFKTQKLNLQDEYRFTASKENIVTIEVLEGMAEWNGCEIHALKQYTFDCGSHSIFTWKGCLLKMNINDKSTPYSSSDNNMLMVLNLHGAFDQIREDATKGSGIGPRVMIYGNADSGKSTICQTLCSIGAVVVSKTLPFKDSFNTLNPLVHHYGYKNPSDNICFYIETIKKMARNVECLCKKQPLVNQSGFIINTSSHVADGELQSVIATIKSFKVDIVIIMDSEKLVSDINKHLGNEIVKILLVPKSSGVVEKTRLQKMEMHDSQILEYFYSHDNTLQPCSFELSFDAITLVRMSEPVLPDALMPVKNSQKIEPIVMEPSRDLLHHILSISSATQIEEVTDSHVMGFYCVTDVNMNTRSLKVLAPIHKPSLYTVLILMDNIQYLD